MEIRYDLLSSIERFCLLENSIKEKLNSIEGYTEFFQKIIQIKIIEKAFDVNSIITEIEEEKTHLRKTSKEEIKECIIGSIQSIST